MSEGHEVDCSGDGKRGREDEMTNRVRVTKVTYRDE